MAALHRSEANGAEVVGALTAVAVYQSNVVRSGSIGLAH